MVGPVAEAVSRGMFRKENYGIVFPSNSPLRKRVNEELLKLKENGVYDQLYVKWFGGAGN